eukprot:2908592-Prymnesium_polylepis.1
MSSEQREAKLPESRAEPCFLVHGRFQSANDSPTNEAVAVHGHALGRLQGGDEHGHRVRSGR